MTAIPKSIPAPSSSFGDDNNQHFLRFVPAVETHARITFRELSELEKEEAVAEAVAAAFCNFVSVARRGKVNTLRAGTLARYAALHVKDGRHVGGRRESKTDVLSWRAAGHRRFAVHRLHGPKDYSFDCLSPNENSVWRRALLEDRRTAVPDQVAFRMDWSKFLSQQTDRTRRIIAALAAGNRRCEVAEMFGVTPPSITERMDRVRCEWLAFQEVASDQHRKEQSAA